LNLGTKEIQKEIQKYCNIIAVNSIHFNILPKFYFLELKGLFQQSLENFIDRMGERRDYFVGR